MNGNGQESYFFECIQIVCVTISFVLFMFYCVPYISDTDMGMLWGALGCTLSSLDDSKHCGVADTPQEWDAIQRDPGSFSGPSLLGSAEKEKQALFLFVINNLGAVIGVCIYIHSLL